MHTLSNISGTETLRQVANTTMANTRPTDDHFLTVLDQHPELHIFGYGPARGMGIDVATEHEALRQPFALAQTLDASAWISARMQPCSGRRRRLPTTYSAKHLMEAEAGLYVLNGPFILASLTAGITLDTSSYNPVMFATLRPLPEEHP